MTVPGCERLAAASGVGVIAARPTISAVGVVVPAHNEELLLPRCLDSVLDSLRSLAAPATVAVVLDRCSDRSVSVVESLIRKGMPVLALSACRPGVGAARAAGADALLAAYGPDELWLATTDADSVVPTDWIARQLAHAATGAHAIVGTVRVTDWSEHSPHVARRYARRYRNQTGHRHVHGANLSFHAGAYLAAGGFGCESHDEDVGLIERLEQTGRPVRRVADLAVTTSARRVGRAPAGFAMYLAQLAAMAERRGCDDVGR